MALLGNKAGPQLSAQAAAIGSMHASPTVRYGIAVGAAAVAIAVRLSLHPVLGFGLPYITLFPAIMLSASLGGLGPGLLTTLMCGIAAEFFWIEPAGSWTVTHPADLVGLILFLGIGGVISALNEAWRRGTTAVVQSERRLAAKEGELELVIGRTPLLLTRCSRDGRYVFVNAACAEFFGRRAEDIVGRTISEIMGEQAHAAIRPYIERVLAGKEVDFELEIPYAHSGHRFMHALYTPDRNENGDVIGWIATVTDVTERKRVETDLRRTAGLLENAIQAERAAAHEAERANQLKDQFLATVSHELRAPLNAVLGWAEMLRMGTLGESQRPRAIEAIYSNAKRQAKLIDDLLDVSRIVSGKMQVNRTAVDLGGVVRAALETVQPSADAKRLRLHTDVDDSIGTVLGDPTRLQQILSNLLTNAVKFTPDAGVIRLAVRRMDEFVEIVVSDSGKGISPEFLPWVFEPFRQADGSTTRAYGGLGLGLSIVKSLVEAHRGTVTAHSAGEGQGATFTVRLPIVAAYAEQDEPSVESSPARAAHHRRSLEGVSVLVVDDAPESREVVTVLLQEAGASVFGAGSATDALDVLHREHVDVLLADIAMPGKDGYALLREVRALPLTSKARVPAAALTSFTETGHRERARQAGFQIHLAKPVASRTLVDAVARLADRTFESVGEQAAAGGDRQG